MTVGTHGKSARIYVNGYDMSPYLNSFGFAAEADTVEITNFASSAKEYIAGLTDGTLTGEGFFAGSTVQSDYVFNQALGTTSVWAYYPSGAALGNYGYGIKSIKTSYELTSPIDGAVTLSVEGQSIVGKERIVSEHALIAESTTGSETSIDNTAASTNGAIGYLQVTDVSGGISAQISIQHSSAGTSWADIIAFSTSTGRAAERTDSSADTIKRYTRTAWTLSSSLGSVTFNVGLRRI